MIIPDQMRNAKSFGMSNCQSACGHHKQLLVALAARCDAMPLTVEKQTPLGPSCTGFVEQGAGLSGSSMDVAGLLCCTVQVSFFCSRCAANDWAVAPSRPQLSFISSPDSPQVFYVLWSPGPVRHISENEDVDK